MNNEKYELWDKFLKRWSYERLKDMTLEEYTNIKEENDDYFCYWLESKTDKLGSVWGGSAFKFGIYRRKNGEEKEDSMGRMYSDKYAWLQKYGENKQGAFKKVKDKILKIIEYIQKGELKNIEDVDLGDAIKWKIAFLYQDRNNPKVVPIFKKEILEYLCGVSGSNISELYAKLMDEKPESEDIFEYAERLMKEFISRNPPNTGSKSNNGGGTIPKEIKEIKEMDKILENKKQTILYGVPGTGKTYLANKYIKEKTSNGKNNSEFTTFHQSYSYEDFIEGYRPKNDDNGNISYKVEDGIFKKMCILAIWEVLKNKNAINIDFNTLIEKFKEKYPPGSTLPTLKQEKPFRIIDYGNKSIRLKPTNKQYSITFSDLKDMLYCEINGGKLKKEPDKISLINKNGNTIGHVISGRTSYGCTIYNELKLAGLPAYGELEENTNLYDNRVIKNNQEVIIDNIDNETYEEIKKEVIQKLKEHRKSKNVFRPEDFENTSKYYLIIDEINRGNISNILGELITLLEKDKRLGEDNEIIIDLPYSKEPFAVPPNLYIIGTMNTADKSIALLDTALRRRFGFLEIEPNYDLITKDNLINVWKEKCNDKEFNKIKKEDIEKMFQKLGNDEFLKKLLETINTKITLLKDRDHRIGHSYFLNVKDIDDLRFVWYNEIIPLLMEYFYNDWESLKEILKGFVKSEKHNKIINSDLIDIEEQKIYRIKEFEDDKEFIDTLTQCIFNHSND